MKYYYLLLLVVLVVVTIPMQQVKAKPNLDYEYSVVQDNQSQKYIFSITFHSNYTIYAVNMSIGLEEYHLTQSLDGRTFYTYVANNLQNKNVVLTAYSSIGSIYTSFTIHQQQEKIQINNDFVSYMGFVVLLGLETKYVLFYIPKESK